MTGLYIVYGQRIPDLIGDRMPISIDATVGGSNSNAYMTLLRANSLIEELPHAGDWLSNPSIRKDRMLLQATRLIDRRMIFFGARTSASQSLEWPRTGIVHAIMGKDVSSAIIPDFIESAMVEWMLALHASLTREFQAVAGVRSLRTPSYDIEFSHIDQDQMPLVVAELLLPYGERRQMRPVRLERA